MPEWFLVVTAIVSLGGGAFGLVISFRTWKKTSPIEEVRKEIEDKWQKFYKEKWDPMRKDLDDVDRKLELVSGIESNKKYMKTLLRSMMLLIEHEVTGNHVEKLKEMARTIDDLLIDNL